MRNKFKETLRIIEEGLLKPMSTKEAKDIVLDLSNEDKKTLTFILKAIDHDLCRDIHSFINYAKTNFYNELDNAKKMYDELLSITEKLKYDHGFHVIANGSKYVMNGYPVYIGPAQRLLIPLVGALYDKLYTHGSQGGWNETDSQFKTVGNARIAIDTFVDGRVLNIDIFIPGKTPGEDGISLILVLVRDDAVEKLKQFAKEKHIV